MLLREIKNIFHLELEPLYPIEEVDSIFYILIEHYLSLERFILALRPDLIISKEEEQPLFEALTQLKLQKPIQQITGRAYFMDLDFAVDENVLIPRSETEELVRWILGEVRVTKYELQNRAGENSEFRILDIGTGCGCIAIALAKNLVKAKVYALDVSEKALEVAKRNAELNEVEIELVQANIMEDVSIDGKFDVIVSNPPYVRESEKKEISKNVKDYEPGMALFVPDEDPLKYYQSIAEFAVHNLNDDGRLYLEINQYLAKETEQLLRDHNFKDIELRKDLFGNNRMLKGVLV
ncbi:MAG: peptide chain release factor N(5)-glutamine methyltransferase [Aurantibacter sp.]